MKKIVLAFILLTSFLYSEAQVKEDSIPAYERIPTIPPFTIMTVPDSVRFAKEDLKKKKPLVIIVFSPDCEHCRQFTKKLLAQFKLVKKAQVVMYSVLPYELVKKFYEEDKIADYPGITVGRDINNFLGIFFNVRNFPTVIVYNKKGKFVKRLNGAVTVEQVVEAINNK